MIIKEYNTNAGFEEQRKIMMDILKDINIEMHDNFSYVRPDIVVGFDILTIFDMNFSFGKVMDFTKLDVPIGFFSGCKVYLDFKLKHNEVIVGNYPEIKSYIIKGKRKEKLMRINAPYDTKNSS